MPINKYPPSGGGGGAVDSVNGQTGVVSLTSTNIPEGTKKYYTDTRVNTLLLSPGPIGSGTANTAEFTTLELPKTTSPTVAQWFGTSDTDTGPGSDGDGQLFWACNGQERMRLDDQGNLSIDGDLTAANFPTTGGADRMAVFNGSGDLVDSTEYQFNATNFNGEQFNITVVPTNAGDYQTLHSHYSALNPTVADADQNWNMHFYEFSAGDDNSGNQVGDLTNGSMFGMSMSVRSIQTSNVGNMQPFSSYISMGNGTDPMTGRNLTGYYFNASLNTGGVEVEWIIGSDIGFNCQTGSNVTNQVLGTSIHGGMADVNQFFGVAQGVNFSGTVGDLFGYQMAHGFTNVTNGVQGYTDVNQQSSGTIGNNYFSANFSPNLNAVTGGYWGLNISPNIDACAFANGISVNMSNVVSGGAIKAAEFTGDVSITGDLSFTGGLSIGQLSSFSTFTVIDGGGNPQTNNGLITQMNATGTVANCDTLGFNTACLMNLDSSFQGTSGGFGIGLAAMALPNVISMQAGCSIDNVTACAYATTLDAANTGGTIDRLIGARSLAVSLGGTQTINRLYSYFADYFAGDVATDSWGFYDNGAKYNWMANSLKIGTGDTTAHNFEVTGASLFDGNIGFYGTAPIAQPASSGAATAGAVYTATEQTMLQEVYNAVRALGLMS